MTTNGDSRSVAGLDEEGVARWLGSHVDGFGSAVSFLRIGEGQSALSFLISDQAGLQVVLRRPPIGELLESAHDMGREFHILSELGAEWQKVPRVLGYCQDLSVTGVPFYVMEFIPGLTLNRLNVAQQLTPSARAQCGHSLVSTLVELQGIDISQARLDDLRRPKSFAERQLRRWTSQWVAQHSRELPEIDRLAAMFLSRMPVERRVVFVHGDYGLHNALMDDHGQVRSILDWELTTTGDPLADLGQMIAYWTESGAPARQPNAVFKEPVTELEGFITPGAIVSAYAAQTAGDVDDVGFWVAFAYWKTAIIVEGVYSRWLTDPANGVGAGDLGAAVPRLAELAFEALETGVGN